MTATNARLRTPISDAVAAQIRAERAAANLSQEAVFTVAGISKSAYLKLEQGRNVADVSQLAGICDAFGLDLATFFTRAMARVTPPTPSTEAEDLPVLDRTPGRGRGKASDMRSAPVQS